MPISDDTYSLRWRQQHRARQQRALRSAIKGGIDAADEFARFYLPLVLLMQRRGMGSCAIAEAMNMQGHSARTGGPWTDQTVRQLLKRRSAILASDVFDNQPVEQVIGWHRRR